MAPRTQTPRAVVYARQSLGKKKSITDQDRACTDDATEQGWQVVAHRDDKVSASKYGHAARPGWAALADDLRAGHVDIVVVWEASRGDRKLTTWSEFLDLAAETGTSIRVTDAERTLDPADPQDWEWLAREGVNAVVESGKISRRTRRGVKGAAADGKPAAGPAPYGFRRLYDPATGKLVGQEPDPEAAPVVRAIFDQVVASVPLSQIARELNAAGVPPPGSISHRTGSRRWYRMRIRDIVLNPAYVGRRRHNGSTHRAEWEPLVSADTFHAAGRLLGEPARLAQARPGRQVHLLTYLATCHRGHQLTARESFYVCRTGCVSVGRAAVDELVEATAVEALADPKVYRRLRKAGELSDREAQAATDQVATLVAELDDWRASATDGRGTTPESLAAVEAGLAPRIEAAQRRADAAGLDPALRPFVEPGADVEARWEAATVQAKRAVIRALMTVTVRAVGQRSGVPVAERVDITPVTPVSK